MSCILVIGRSGVRIDLGLETAGQLIAVLALLIDGQRLCRFATRATNKDPAQPSLPPRFGRELIADEPGPCGQPGLDPGCSSRAGPSDDSDWKAPPSRCPCQGCTTQGRRCRCDLTVDTGSERWWSCGERSVAVRRDARCWTGSPVSSPPAEGWQGRASCWMAPAPALLGGWSRSRCRSGRRRLHLRRRSAMPLTTLAGLHFVCQVPLYPAIGGSSSLTRCSTGGVDTGGGARSG